MGKRIYNLNGSLNISLFTQQHSLVMKLYKRINIESHLEFVRARVHLICTHTHTACNGVV